MAKDPNLIPIRGRIIKDPETKTTRNGARLTTLTVASNGRSKDALTGEWKDGPTMWWDCTAWRDLADHIAASFHKGDRVIGLARPRPSTYTDPHTGRQRTRNEWELEDLAASTVDATVRITRTKADGTTGRGAAGGSRQGRTPVDDGLDWIDEPIGPDDEFGGMQ